MACTMYVGQRENSAASTKITILLLLSSCLNCSATTWNLRRRNFPSVENNLSSTSSVPQFSQGETGASTFPLSLANLGAGTSLSTIYPVDCFHSSPYLEVTIPADCDFIINEIILRLANPMQEQIFGFNESADVDLSLPENQDWFHGQCIIAVGNRDLTESDTFRPVDVAMAAQRLLQECVIQSKAAVGGSVGIGLISKRFYVILGGLVPAPELSHHPRPISPPSITSKRSNNLDESHTRTLETRLKLPSSLVSPLRLDLRPSCVKHGMPADAGIVEIEDCVANARILLEDPEVLELQTFTTESTGGIQVPFLRRVRNCYIMANTNARYSSSESFSFLKIVYFAFEVLRHCPLGGVAKLTNQGGFFVSVTSLDPVGPGQADLVALLNSTNPGLGM